MFAAIVTEPRITFIHGLEGHPGGYKVVRLREQGFDVQAADMHMSLWSLRKKNSAIRNALRLAETRAAIALGVGGVAAGAWRGSPARALLSLGVSATWISKRRRALIGQGLARSFERCVEIQARAIEARRPTVLVGSSWGGAVAARLVLDGVWRGPTILLAPAIARVRAWTGIGGPGDDTRLRALAGWNPIVIFHDPSDDTVPFADSEALAAGSAIELRSVSAGGHRLLDLLDRGELAEAIRALA